MFKEHHRFFRLLFIFSDLTIIGCSWILAYLIRFRCGLIPIYSGTPDLDIYIAHLPMVITIWTAVFVHLGVYKSRRWLKDAKEYLDILKASVISMTVLVCMVYLSTKTEISRIFYLCFFLISIGLISISRLLLRALLRYIRRKGFNIRHLLIVGRSLASDLYIKRLKEHPEIGCVIKGILVDSDDMRSLNEVEIPVLGTLDNLRHVIANEGIDIVIFALPLESQNRLGGLLRNIEDLPVDIFIIPDIYQIIPLRLGIEDFEGVPIIQIRESPQQGPARIIKRAIDIVLSVLGIILFSPVMILIALFIRVTSGPPVIYTQRRMGLDGRVFRIFKFRTMYNNAEKDIGPVWPRFDDPRRTPIGKFLRRYSLDELPQFWNVLKGEMSLVGPRPERPEFINEFRQRIPGYMLRYRVKAGLTGWAQVNGLRGNTSLKKRIDYDIQYMERWSVGFDLKILLLTLLKGFVNRSEQTQK